MLTSTLRLDLPISPGAPGLTGMVFDVRRYSIHDGPGIRTAVFFKGCPLSCQWCHNPESRPARPELLLRPGRCIACGACVAACQPDAIRFTPPGDGVEGGTTTDRERCIDCGKCTLVCPAEAREMVGRPMSVGEVMAAIERDRAFYEGSGGGATFTGGEPLAQPAFLLALLRACRERGLHTVVDTSGFASWTILDEIRPFVDLFLYDLKLMDDARHREFTGVPNGPILTNLRRLAGAGHALLVRIPVIPGVNDDEENLRQAGIFLAGLPQAPPVELLAYHNIAEAKYAGLGQEYGLSGVRPPDAARMSQVADLLRGYGLDVRP